MSTTTQEFFDLPELACADVGGVALNILNGTAARDTYTDMVERVARLQPGARINGVTVQKMAAARRGREVYVGMVTDEPFGPVIVFGAGGTMIELMADRAMELPPLNQYLARRLIAETPAPILDDPPGPARPSLRPHNHGPKSAPAGIPRAPRLTRAPRCRYRPGETARPGRSAGRWPRCPEARPCPGSDVRRPGRPHSAPAPLRAACRG